MPPRRIIRDDTKLCETREICIILNLQMCAGDFHMVVVTQLFSGQFHGIKYYAGCVIAYSVQVKIKILLIQQYNQLGKLFFRKSRAPLCLLVSVRNDHSSGMDLQGAIHKRLHGMHLQVFRVKLAPEALQFLHAFFHLPRRRDHEASIDIYRELTLSVQFAQTFVGTLMERV